VVVLVLCLALVLHRSADLVYFVVLNWRDLRNQVLNLDVTP
jgi:hypothetical protein